MIWKTVVGDLMRLSLLRCSLAVVDVVAIVVAAVWVVVAAMVANVGLLNVHLCF